MHTIRQFVEKIKSFTSSYLAELGVSLIIILVAFSSFYLGRTAGLSTSGISIESSPELSLVHTSVVDNIGMTASAGQALAPEPKAQVKGPIVASKNGARYYYPHCSGVSRLSEKNKIYFQTAAEAESFGLTLAQNCNAK